MLLHITPRHVDHCPCGRPVTDVTPVELPARPDQLDGCVIDAVAPDHFGLDSHPHYRPDVLVVGHDDADDGD